MADGASVTIAGRSPERLAGAAAELEALAAGRRVRRHRRPATWPTRQQVRDGGRRRRGQRSRRASTSWWRPPVGAGSGRIITTSLEEWDGIVGTNLTGHVPHVQARRRGASARSGAASMVAISSIAGVSTHRFMGPYCVSKAGIDMLVQNLADELGVAGVRVNSVRPGLVETELVDAVMADESIVGDYLDQMPVRRVGQVERHRRRWCASCSGPSRAGSPARPSASTAATTCAGARTSPRWPRPSSATPPSASTPEPGLTNARPATAHQA